MAQNCITINALANNDFLFLVKDTINTLANEAESTMLFSKLMEYPDINA